MLLGLSGAETDHDIQPADLRGGAGVPHGEMLVRFVDATFASGDALTVAREECAEALGGDGVVDVAAVVANFHMMTRIADSTGTPLDSGFVDFSADLRSELGLQNLSSRRLESATD